MTAADSDQLAPARIVASGLVARVEYHGLLSSTQDLAHQIARADGPVPLPLLVVAEEQTAGRGRGKNQWWTARGSLAFSLLFDPADWSLSRQPLPERSLAVGVAIVDTVTPLLSGHSVGLHWPNDVFVAGKKLAGILIDVLPDGRHVVGIGLNVNNGFDGAPDEVRLRATSLRDLTGRDFDRTTLLIDLLDNVRSAIKASAVASAGFGVRYQQLCLQLGKELTIEAGSQRATGRCAGIGLDGALLLETADGWQKFYSGVLR